MTMQNNKTERLQRQGYSNWFGTGVFLFIMSISNVWANNLSITELNFSSLAGNKLQIELGMNGKAMSPKVFQTDNPARIALDFVGVSSQLGKKMYPVNQGAAGVVYVVGTANRTRVVVNLTKNVPYDLNVVGNKVYVVLKPVAVNVSPSKVEKVVSNGSGEDRRISNLLPKQTIGNIDFRRGSKGEGRLLLQLSAKNTVVDVQDRAGKIVLNFLNTSIPAKLVKMFDVSDFATPVQRIETRVKGSGVSITISTIDGNYDYSSYQSDGLLTVDFCR